MNESTKNLNKDYRQSKVGEKKVSLHGDTMVIERYESTKEIWIRFIQTGYVKKTRYQAFERGRVKDPYFPSVYGVGYLGEGSPSAIDGELTRAYRTWYSMMTRCYSPKFLNERAQYRNCTVTPEWHNFQNFKKFYDENYYEIEGERISLDKDILFKSNTVYSPDTCIFVPQLINSLFTFSDAVRTDLPLGVRKSGKKFTASSNIKVDGRKMKKYMGQFDTPEEAFQAYKEYKEAFHKSVADQYRGKIPEHVYEAICNYKIEITD